MTRKIYFAVPLLVCAGIWGFSTQLAAPAPRAEHPHPITAEHQRLRRERALLAQLDQAVDFHDGRALGSLLDQYRREFPEDEQRLQAGYGVIAECLNAPGASSRSVAADFYAQQRGSSLRRWVRRVCLESGKSAMAPSPSVALR